MTDISNTEDVLDVRDIIERVEDLRLEIEERKEEIATLPADEDDTPEIEKRDELAQELSTLESLLADLKGNGGDHQWEGDWYPVTLIRDSYFETYAQELAEDIGAVNADAGWPNGCIDWERAARELQIDYTSVEFDGVTYWYR